MPTTRSLTVAGVEVHCPICSHDEFWRQQIMVSAGVEARLVVSESGDRDWKGRVNDGEPPVAEVCGRCGHILLFATDA